MTETTAKMVARLRSRKGLAIQECEAIADQLVALDTWKMKVQLMVQQIMQLEGGD